MTRVAFDSNILIDAKLEPDSEKGARAIDLILRSTRNGVIPLQVGPSLVIAAGGRGILSCGERW